MPDRDECMRNAQRCLTAAKGTTEDKKRRLLTLAVEWMALAEQGFVPITTKDETKKKDYA